MNGLHVYVGYNGSVSCSDTVIEVNQVFAQLLNLSEGDPIQVIVCM